MAIVKMVYVGWCELDGGEPGAALNILNEDDSLGREVYFARKALASSMIGGVYEVEQTGPTSFALVRKQYRGKYHDEALVAEWQMATRAKQVALEAAKLERKDKEVPEALRLMEPLRSLYKKSLPDRRRAIEALLLNYLRQ